MLFEQIFPRFDAADAHATDPSFLGVAWGLKVACDCNILEVQVHVHVYALKDAVVDVSFFGLH